jgi:hypothetical protein
MFQDQSCVGFLKLTTEQCRLRRNFKNNTLKLLIIQLFFLQSLWFSVTVSKANAALLFLLLKFLKSWCSFHQKSLSSNDWVYFTLYRVLLVGAVF